MRMPVTKPHSIKIEKANSRATVAVAIAAVIVVFSLVSARALLQQGAYQRRVVNAKNDTVKQLEQNIEAASDLTTQYKTFAQSNPNVLGGNATAGDAATPPDGSNPRIVLNALPTTYDFPALISSLSKLMNANNIEGKSFGGSDQADAFDSQPSPSPQPVEILQLPLGGSTSYAGLQQLIKDLERSIRPYDITSLQLSGNQNRLSFNTNVTTYFQPAKIIKTETKEVK